MSESGTQTEGGQAPEGAETPEGGAPPEGTAGAGGSGGDNTPDPVAEARAAAEAARTAADEARASATTEAASVAADRSKLADQQLAFAEQQAAAGNDQFPKEVVDKARQEAAGYRTKLREREAEVKALKDAAKSDVERLEGVAGDAEKRAVSAEGRLERLLVSRAKGLPDELADRLVGKDKAELEADADALIESLGVETQQPNLDQGARGGGARPPAGGSGGDARSAMNDFIRSHGGRRELPGQSGSTSA